jgi:Kdo2-lipid IVA lauroyltransferase/acyltransferase
VARPRPFRPLRQRLEALLLRGLGRVSRSLGFERAGDLGAVIGGAAFHLLPRRRSIAIDNVTRALGDRPEGNPPRALVRRAFEQLGRSFLEFLSLPAEPPERLLSRVEFVGFEPAEEWARTKRGAILLTGHFGNWELIGAAYRRRFAPTKYVLPAQTNPGSDAYLNEVRRKLGIEPIVIGQGMRAALRSLRAGETLGMLPDQDARRAGIHVPFFGRPASTHTGPARLAVSGSAPILVAVLERIGRGRFRARAILVTEPDPKREEREEVLRLTREITAALEGAIRERPDHWYWIHRRWKTPPGTPDPRALPKRRRRSGQEDVNPISFA